MTTELRIPNVGESIQEVQIGKWLKQDGDTVAEDENVVELETEKASLELPSPVAGVLKIVKQQGEAATIGETIAYVDSEANGSGRAAVQPAKSVPAEKPSSNEPATPAAQPKQEATGTPASSEHRDAPKVSPPPPAPARVEAPAVHATPSARRALREHQLAPEEVVPSGKQIRREDVERHVEKLARPTAEKPAPSPAPSPKPVTKPAPEKKVAAAISSTEREQVVPMTLIRRKIAERLLYAQKNAALLTTYNEIDMTEVMSLRQQVGERFKEKHGVKLGFMSFFVKAVIEALKEVPALNAEIRDTNIVYRTRYDIGVAIGSEHGLVVPVLRDADRMTFSEIERAIADFATRASSRKLEPSELVNGTFTISNGGIYGSLLSTPIVNPPQSGVLGMHAIQERPVARDKQVVIRPMMYIALTYDHRIVDGREAVTWLRRVKESVEQPARMLVEV